MNLIRKTFLLLSKKNKKNTFVLFFLILIGVFLETLGIGLIIPLFSIIVDPNFAKIIVNFINEYLYFLPENLLSYLSNPELSHKHFIGISLLFIISIYLIKSFFMTFLIFKQTNFIKDISISFINKLFYKYLYMPYSYHLKTNSSYLWTNIVDCSSLSLGLNSALSLLTEILVSLSIVTLLIILNPIGGILVIFVFIFFGSIIFYFTSKKLSAWNTKRHFFDGQRLKDFFQTLGGLKEIKLLNKEKNFLEKFSKNNSSSFLLTRNNQFVQQIPRIFLELVALVGLSLLLFTMLMQDLKINNIIPVIGVFAAAAFRIMPSVNRIIGQFQIIRYGMPIINKIYKEITQINFEENYLNISDEKILFKDKIQLENVEYSYETRSQIVLSNITFEVPLYSQIGIVGESGSGKSTLVNLMLGLLKPNKGEVKVDGKNIQSNLKSWQHQIGYVPQNIYLMDDTLKNNIALGEETEDIDDKLIKDAVKLSGLQNFISNLPNGLDTIVGERGAQISGGQLQRVGIARALYNKPKVLILDEATSSLDLDTEKNLMKEIEKLKGTITLIIISHRLSTISNCDKILKIRSGKINTN